MSQALLISALEQCRNQFAMYRDNHIAKMTPDSLREAATNQEMVGMIERAIEGYNDTPVLTPATPATPTAGGFVTHEKNFSRPKFFA